MNDWNINVGAVVSIVITLFSFAGAVVGLSKYFKTVIKNIISDSLKPLEDKIDNNTTKIDSVKFDNCKNYVVDFLSKVENGKKITNDELLRFSENYRQYIEMGGNSYVKNWVERLKSEGKLDHKPMV